MTRAILCFILLLVSGCTSLPDTPIGNYTGWGRCSTGQCAVSEPTVAYRCVLRDGTAITVRGARADDPNLCVTTERI